MISFHQLHCDIRLTKVQKAYCTNTKNLNQTK